MQPIEKMQTRPYLEVYPVDPDLAERVYASAEMSEIELSRRIDTLERTPSAEQALSITGSVLSLLGLGLGLKRSKKWFALPGLGAALFLLARLPAGRVVRKFLGQAGLPESEALEREKAALYTLRSDFTGLATPPGTNQERVELALQAAGGRRVSNLIFDRETPNEVATLGSIQFIGTATLLIRYGGFTILTDPNFIHAGEHFLMGHILPVKRLTNPALEIDDLPPLDLCLLSHMHGDHFDQVAEARLPKSLPIFTTPQAARTLRSKGFGRSTAMQTWDTITLYKGESWLRITSTPGRHGPAAVNPLLPPVMGSLLEWGQGDDEVVRYRMYISGDTLIHDDLYEIPRRYPNLDMAVLHLGGTRMMGLLLTMDAEQGVRALDILQPTEALPVHFNDYGMFRSPLVDFIQAVDAAHLPVKMHYLLHGESIAFGAVA